MSLPLFAQGTRLWTRTRFEDFEKGTPQGVAIGNDGTLRAGPVVSEMVTTPSTFVWAVATDKGKAGVAYLGTGSPATVLRVAPDGKGGFGFTTLLETKALAVQVLRMGPDGALYAATLPDGKVYRIKSPGGTDVTALDETSAEVIFDLSKADKGSPDSAKSESKSTDTDASESKKPENKSHYIWDMTFDSAGKLYIATGGPGAVYRVDVGASAPGSELFFKSDEQHVRALAWDKAGNLLAGTDGSGLVYRIDRDGKGYVLFSAPRREITALAVDADGTVYASDVGDKSHNPLPPLAVASGGASITINFSQPGSVQAANASTSLPEGSEIYALTLEAAPRKIWAGKDEIVYGLATGKDGLTAFTGNRGRIFTIHADGSYSDVAHLDAQQATAWAAAADGWLVGTGNTGKLYRLSPEKTDAAEAHSYASDVLDAGALARWGRIEVDPGSHSYQIWTRSGNVEQPARSAKDWGWSEWQPTADDKVASPAGRYLQWKAVLNDSGVVSGIGINYLPVNSAPVVDDVVVVAGARVMPQPQSGQPAAVAIAFANGGATAAADGSSAAAVPIQAQKDKTAITVRWEAHDDDGDDLSYDLFLRGDGEHVWRPFKKKLTDKVYSFDAASVPDGGYQIRVVASDAPSHTPGDVLTAELVSERFEVDTTAPVISDLKAGAAVPGECRQSPCPRTLSIPVSFDAKDAASPIGHAEYSVDAGPWQFLEPVGGLSDSKEEHYYAPVPLPIGSAAGPDAGMDGEHLIAVRVYDRYDNMAAAKVVVPAAGSTTEEK